MSERTERCETCACWQPKAGSHGDGECRANPPGPSGVWPTTWNHGWCSDSWRPTSDLIRSNLRWPQLLGINAPVPGIVEAPRRGTSHSACWDLCAAETVAIPAGAIVAVSTGLVLHAPTGHHIQVYPRSSLSLRKGLLMANSVGIIDEDYCGPEDVVHVILLNTRTVPVTVARGERIAQAMLVPTVLTALEHFEPAQGSRGGLGSTGGYIQTEVGRV